MTPMRASKRSARASRTPRTETPEDAGAGSGQKRRRTRMKRVRREYTAHERRIALLIVLGIVAVALYSVLVPVQAGAYGSAVAVTMLLGAAATAAPLVSVTHPDLAMVLFTGPALLIPLTVSRDPSLGGPWPWSVPMLLAFAVIVTTTTFQYGWRRGLVQLALGTAAGLVAAIMLPAIPSANSLIVTTAVVGGIYLLAVLLAGRLRLGRELTRERAHTAQEQARRELVEERTRIARELHDVVAHGMSVIQVQASTARYRVPELTDDAAQEFEDIAASARSALTEMRRILGVLRTEDQELELAPQRGVDDVPALVETVRRAGAEVALTTEVSGDISPATQIAAYRIIQEALSNAVRHAPGTAIEVVLRTDEASLTLSVRNPTTDAASEALTSGHGVRGMNERATLLGGALTAGVDAEGIWRVSATLPRHPAPFQEGSV
ncbi:sensor histidine kinase [Microbacterium sp. NPDC055903]